jgi:hypothetical protein
MKFNERSAVIFLLSVVVLFGAVAVGDRTFSGFLDASGASWTKPAKSGTSLPTSCTAGEQYFKTDATAGQNLHLCTATNTWTQISGGGGGSSAPDCTVGTSICIVEEFCSESHPFALGWDITGAGTAYTAGVAGHPCIRKITSGASSGDLARAYLGATAMPVVLNGSWSLTCTVRVERTTSAAVTCGLSSDLFLAHGATRSRFATIPAPPIPLISTKSARPAHAR